MRWQGLSCQRRQRTDGDGARPACRSVPPLAARVPQQTSSSREKCERQQVSLSVTQGYRRAAVVNEPRIFPAGFIFSSTHAQIISTVNLQEFPVKGTSWWSSLDSDLHAFDPAGPSSSVVRSIDGRPLRLGQRLWLLQTTGRGDRQYLQVCSAPPKHPPSPLFRQRKGTSLLSAGRKH